MGRLESKRYYEIYVNGQFETSYKDRVAANLAVGQLFQSGHEVKVLSFERGAKRNFENKPQKINRTHIVKHEEYGTLSNIMMKKDGTKVYTWHHDGDGRRAKLFSDNLTALSVAKRLGAKIKQVSYADVSLNSI
ncbi:hypothetical protein [Leuconostoc gasicomitatum]|uniref:hypothetical protein n=1 Tax=Leuconostoc gasicomitatum TaxID=115778 RepID=UPI001CC3B41A|nr:hypothetical protein [Leuconostoc gasicomitatum]MBZ5968995.1 hypothetical protein [Leuconostoc gasicomitatum]